MCGGDALTYDTHLLIEQVIVYVEWGWSWKVYKILGYHGGTFATQL